jgi:DNA sulfur modification protein DndD
MENIQIFELTLKDYRQYGGENKINLETTGENNINVIVGQNGAGKSNILNAITLCFYGEEAHIDSRETEGLESDPYVTKRTLDGLDPGDRVQGFVEVKIGKESPKYRFRRTFTTARQPDDEAGQPVYTNSLGELSLLQRFGGSDWEPIPDPENVLREILPNHVHQYFFFDGEQLDEFFDQGYSDRVKEAVLDVSHIELIDNGISHLEAVQRDFERQSSKIGGDVSQLQSRKERAKEEHESLKDDYETLQKDISQAKDKLETINSKLSASGDEKVREKQIRRELLEEELDDKRSELTEAKAAVGPSMAKAGGIAYNADALIDAIDHFEQYEAQTEQLPGLTEDLLEAVLARGQCVCGTALTDKEEAREHVDALLSEISEDSKQDLSGRLRMKRVLSSGEQEVRDLVQHQASVEDIRNWIDEKETEVKNISAALEDKDTIDNERATELESQRQRVSDRISSMEREAGGLEQTINKQEQTVEERRKEWREAMEEQDENSRLVSSSVFIGDGIDALRGIKQDILDQVRSETESRLERYYNDLIWKDEEYTVALTDDYQVELFNQDGKKNIGSLAAGERQVLALSFMASLSKISGFSAPIVIDTPLGRISSDPRKRIAQNVPTYLEDTQVTFLMTDVEYSEDVQAFISNEVANEYYLDYQDGTTKVV